MLQLTDQLARSVYRHGRAAVARTTLRGRVIEDWRELAAHKYPKAAQLAGQCLIRPYIHRCRVGGVPTDLLMATQEGWNWYEEPDLFDDELAMYAHYRLARPGAVVFDLGANQGVTTVALARMVGPRGKVYAFDPFPLNCDLIRLNCRLNRLDNVEVIEAGLGDRAGMLAVSAHQQTLAADTEPAPDAVTVRVETLDTYADLRPDFVKVDIEGAEVSALSAAGKVLARRPNLFVELHRQWVGRFGRRCEELDALLPHREYRVAGLWASGLGLSPIRPDTLDGRPGNRGHVVLAG